MTPQEFAGVGVAGFGAGLINAIVGSGTLLTFSTMVAIGVPPVVANVSNTVGLVPGSISAAVGYRRELAGQRGRTLRLMSASLVGSAVGAVLLLALPERAFATIVPVLIGLGILLVVFGGPLSRAVARRHEADGGLPDAGLWWVWPAVFVCGIYGGYFG
ncbi:MAG: sulfite exporter TauE/SafE family protein, partial [Nocardioides sp.]